jgi:ATP-dependent Clp protease adapter protein ClpS
MERNHAASRALLLQLDKKSITDLGEFSEELWMSINTSSSESHILEITNDGVTPLEFIVKLFIKVGFSCEDAIRLMMKTHKEGSIVLARSDEGTLLSLQAYINSQAKNYNHNLPIRVIKI